MKTIWKICLKTGTSRIYLPDIEDEKAMVVLDIADKERLKKPAWCYTCMEIHSGENFRYVLQPARTTKSIVWSKCPLCGGRSRHWEVAVPTDYALDVAFCFGRANQAHQHVCRKCKEWVPMKDCIWTTEELT